MEPNFRYRVHNSATIVLILRQTNPVYMSHIIFPRDRPSTVLLLSLDRLKYVQYNLLWCLRSSGMWRGVLLELVDELFWYVATRSSGIWRIILLGCIDAFFWYVATRSSGMWPRILLGCIDTFFWDVAMRSSGMWPRILLVNIDAFFWDVATRSSGMWRRILLGSIDEFFWYVATSSSGLWRHCTTSHKKADLNPTAAKAFRTRKSRSAVVLAAHIRLDPEQKHSMQVPQRFVIRFVTTLPSWSSPASANHDKWLQNKSLPSRRAIQCRTSHTILTDGKIVHRDMGCMWCERNWF